MKKIGIDIGGTFTDLILQDEKDISIFKVPSTPADPAKAALRGLREITRKVDVNPAQIDNGCYEKTQFINFSSSNV